MRLSPLEPRRLDPDRSGWRVGIVGTGGQGVLTAARLLCEVFAQRGHDVVSSQLHGMAQRGGAVQASVIIDGGVSPALAVRSADALLGFEPVETVRAMPLLSSRTLVFMNTAPVVPFSVEQKVVRGDASAAYPAVEDLVGAVRAVSRRVVPIDATALALESGSVKTLNAIMLGCLLGSGLLPSSAEDFWLTLAETVPPAMAEANRMAFERGVAAGEESAAREAESQA